MRVAQLLCSRLCHDLVGPAGAVYNGVELLNEDESGDTGALALVTTSSQRLNGRLAFYRLVFGLGGGSDGTMSLAEAKALATGVIDSNRVTLDWQIDADESIGDGGADEQYSIDRIRLILGLVLIGIDALPRGGTLTVKCAQLPDGLDVTVNASGSAARLGEEILAAMNPDAPAESLTARTVNGHFVSRVARMLNSAVTLDARGSDQVVLMSLLPAPRKTDPIPFQARVSCA